MPRPASLARRSSSLVVDLYELTMAEAYLRAEMNGRATFSLFVRRLPAERRYLVASGLDAALDYLDSLCFTDNEVAFLDSTGRFSPQLLDYLGGLRFSGDVRAIPEGRVVFREEPLIEVTAPLIEAQIVETYLINVLHLHTLLASKAARCVDAAGGRAVVDFGLRRAHGVDAGMAAARAAWIAGCSSTSNVAAGREFGIPISGTMAHSFVASFPSELHAFRAYARTYPDTTTLLIDTYDVEQGARHAATVAHELRQQGHRLRAVRIDSGNLLALSRRVRAILDDAGCPEVEIFGSGGLDEHQIDALVSAGAPIDGFGVGTRMDASEDAPTLEVAYKLVEIDGRPALKTSPGKANWPGRKQVWRRTGPDGRFARDVITLADETVPDAEPLLVPVMRGGRRLAESEPLGAARQRCLDERGRLPDDVRAIDGEGSYPVEFSPKLRTLTEQLRPQQELF
ncbi:MAG: nicotinate phosphoribosyltransferase [Chloroflexi bacterium]|nr:nicotinate phosphoribosyltransferase [Chloroflexota bacterium]